MGNAVAPAPNVSSSPINELLSSTAELDASPIPTISSSPSPPPLIGSLTNNFTAESTAVDVAETAMVNDLLPQQLLYYGAEHDDCDLIRRAVERGAQVSAPDLGLRAQEEERRAADERETDAGGARKKSKAQLREEKEKEAIYKDLIITYDSALHKAAAKGHLQAIGLLCSLDADVEAKNVLGSTPLHRAVSSKQAAAVKALLAKGARLDAVNAIGNSALHVAAFQGEVDIAALLLHHAKHDSYRLVAAPNKAGLTPIDYARKKPMHALLVSHRIAISHTSSFDGAHDGGLTPKYALGEGMQNHLARYGTAPGPSSGSPEQPHVRTLSRGEGGQSQRALPRHGSSEFHAHHHHAPNPPLSSASQPASRSITSSSLLPHSSSSEHQPSSHSHSDHPAQAQAQAQALAASNPVAVPIDTPPSVEQPPSSDDSHVTDDETRHLRLASLVVPVLSEDAKERTVSTAALSTLSFRISSDSNGAVEEEKEQHAIITATS